MVSDLKKHLDIINTCFERNGMKFLSIHGNVNTTYNMVCSFAADSLSDPDKSFKFEHGLSHKLETLIVNQQNHNPAYNLQTTETEIKSFVEVKKQVEGLLGDAGDIIKSFLMDFALINIDYQDLDTIKFSLYDGMTPSLFIKFSEYEFFKLDIKHVFRSTGLAEQAKLRRNRLKPLENTNQEPT